MCLARPPGQPAVGESQQRVRRGALNGALRSPARLSEGQFPPSPASSREHPREDTGPLLLSGPQPHTPACCSPRSARACGSGARPPARPSEHAGVRRLHAVPPPASQCDGCGCRGAAQDGPRVCSGSACSDALCPHCAPPRLEPQAPGPLPAVWPSGQSSYSHRHRVPEGAGCSHLAEEAVHVCPLWSDSSADMKKTGS